MATFRLFKFDYHMHTDYSTDSTEPMENVIKKAIDVGLNEIAITDHFDFTKQGELIKGTYPLAQYKEKIKKFQEQYQDQINILFGAEIGVGPHLVDQVCAFVRENEFDFIIGSTHDSLGLELYSGEFFEGKTKELAFQQYFEEVLINIQTIKEFHVYGHLDYIRRYGGYQDNSLMYETYQEVIDEILKALVQTGRGLEINTSGYRYGLDQVHPQLAILKRYKAIGGEILTLGSDAHRAVDVGADLNRAREIAKEAGFSYFTRFEKKQPVFVSI